MDVERALVALFKRPLGDAHVKNLVADEVGDGTVRVIGALVRFGDCHYIFVLFHLLSARSLGLNLKPWNVVVLAEVLAQQIEKSLGLLFSVSTLGVAFEKVVRRGIGNRGVFEDAAIDDRSFRNVR